MDHQRDLGGRRIAVLCTDGVEQSELEQSLQRLRAAGACCDLIAPQGTIIESFIRGKQARSFRADIMLDVSSPQEYTALILPGGLMNADALRSLPSVVSFVAEMIRMRKPVGAIGHAPWLLAECEALRGRTVTSSSSISTDMRNAGAQWIDRSVVVDGSLVTSRKGADLLAFTAQMIDLTGRAPAMRQKAILGVG